MGQLLAQVIPLGLAAAVSPVIFIAVVAILGGRDPVPRGTAYALGASVPLIVLAVVLLAFGAAISLKESPDEKMVLDFVLAAVLFFVGFHAVRSAPPAERPPKPPRPGGAGRLVPLGIGMMATNFTSIALFVPAMKLISESTVEASDKVVAVAVVILLALSSILIPLALVAFSPGTAGRVLARVGDWLTAKQRLFGIVFGFGFGLFFLIKAIAAL